MGGAPLWRGKTVGEGAAFSLLLPAHASLPFFHSMHEEGIILCKVLEGKDGGMGGGENSGQWSVIRKDGLRFFVPMSPKAREMGHPLLWMGTCATRRMASRDRSKRLRADSAPRYGSRR